MRNKTPSLEHALDTLFAAGPEAEARTLHKLHAARTQEAASPLFFDRLPDSPIGPVYFAANARGLVAVDFGIPEADFLAHVEKDFGQRPTHAPEQIASFKRQLAACLSGREKRLDLPFDISSLTSFQQQVLRAALQIPRGQVYTYADVARQIGNPKAARAVGQALGRNPVSLVIPCHRVIASDGKLGGYSGSGGVETKRRLLVMEGALSW